MSKKNRWKIDFKVIFNFLKHESIIDIICLGIWWLVHILLLVFSIKLFFWEFAIYCLLAVYVPLLVLSSETNNNKEILLVCIKWLNIGFWALLAGGVGIIIVSKFLVQIMFFGFSYVSDFFSGVLKF
ncbi:MAG: hypothetical protein WCH58_03140 [Candidatus Saccharibacteria bacterium]